ncbi:hypothetical protein TSUD_52230 [Trifolium subterraneum]|uniref:F-box associated domain-containing protein n=1 Tax=Trifolium subterraneum TaxID=3900 RepID=A0A2Z6N0N2_TRISU|nr:hypothetical protein TSUD_52230 [Trifolium subterraneum]
MDNSNKPPPSSSSHPPPPSSSDKPPPSPQLSPTDTYSSNLATPTLNSLTKGNDDFKKPSDTDSDLATPWNSLTKGDGDFKKPSDTDTPLPASNSDFKKPSSLQPPPTNNNSHAPLSLLEGAPPSQTDAPLSSSVPVPSKPVVINNYIPEDFMLSIFCKLPIKAQGSEENVISKSESLDSELLLNRVFVDNFNNMLESSYNSNVYLLSPEDSCQKKKLELPHQFNPQHIDIPRMLGSATNNIVCLYDYANNCNTSMLWNVATEEINAIPVSSAAMLLKNVRYHAFGYDHCRDDYKIIQCVGFDFEDYQLSDNVTQQKPVW